MTIPLLEPRDKLASENKKKGRKNTNNIIEGLC